MNGKKLEQLKKRLAEIEYRTIIETGLDTIHNAFVEVKMLGFCPESNHVWIEVNFGVRDTKNDWKEVEDYTLYYDTLEYIK